MVDFPHQMGCYLEHGAEIGYCTSGGGSLTDDEGGDGIFEMCANMGGDDEDDESDDNDVMSDEITGTTNATRDGRLIGRR